MRRRSSGVSLIEVLLVLAIMGMMLVVISRYLQQKTQQAKYDKMAVQMQQILSAGMSYYVNTGKWPVWISGIQCLQGNVAAGADCTVAYLPTPFMSPFGQPYRVADGGSSSSPFYVISRITSAQPGAAKAYASVVAGMLPLAYTSGDIGSPLPVASNVCGAGTSCEVVTSVNVPPQALEVNKGYLNFAGLYHPGSCVPVPVCPANSQPQVFVVPAQMQGTDTAGGIYTKPITAFGAYAVGPSHWTTIPNCPNVSVNPGCYDVGTVNATQQYWRVCATVTTDRDVPSSNQSEWAIGQVLLAVTRCSPLNGEAVGSNFVVYSGSATTH